VNRSQRLQRLAVRMLYDERFRARVLDGEEALDDSDRALLTTVDPRAWSTDPYRSGRTLAAILSELPVTGALLGASRALEFFHSTAFHTAIEGRGSLVLSFGRWAGVGPIGELELATAQLRRARRSPPPPGSLALGERFHPIAVPEGTLAAYDSLRRTLGPETISSEPLRAPPLGDDLEHLLVERAADGSIAIGTIGESLSAVLAPLLAGPRTEREMRDQLQSLGAGDEAEEILRGLLADGVLLSGS
jgi:hypothetical protein